MTDKDVGPAMEDPAKKFYKGVDFPGLRQDWRVPNPVPFLTRLRVALERGVLTAAQYGLALAIVLGVAWFAFVEYTQVRAWARNGQAAYEWAVKMDAQAQQARQAQAPKPEATPEPTPE